MEDLSLQRANGAIRGFGMNSQVNPAVRAAIRNMSPHIVSHDPENCQITVDLSKEIDPAEILRHFPANMHENFSIRFAETTQP